MIQQGQVFKLKAKCADGEPLWAYRYRRRGSRLGEAAGGRVHAPRPRRRGRYRTGWLGSCPAAVPATLTLAEWVEEYLERASG